MEKMMNKIFEELQKLNGRMDSIDGHIDKIDERLDNLDGRIDKIDGRIDKLDQRMNTLETGQGEIKKELSSLSDKLDILATQQNEDIIAILKRMDHNLLEVKSDVHSLTNIQERQEDVIRLLSSRSIEHEAILKRNN